MVPSTPSITVIYNITAPMGMRANLFTTAKPTHASAEIRCPITMTSASGQSRTSQYYEAASAAVLEAQANLNEILTTWKDAMGDREKAKEDMGKVAYGQGRASRMTAEANSSAIVAQAEESGSDEDEDEGQE